MVLSLRSKRIILQNSEKNNENMAAKIFISYAHRDESFKDDLQIGLASLKNNGHIAAWDDHAIMAGEEWNHQIKDALYEADIIILLVSPNFLASRYVREQEIKIAMERHTNPSDPAVVVPVIIRPCDWKDNAFSRLQALPKNSKPITSWSNHDEAMLDVVSGIKKLVMRKKDTPSIQPTASATSSPATSYFSTPPLEPKHLDTAKLKKMIGAGKTKNVIATLLADQNLDGMVRNQVIMMDQKFRTLQNEKLIGILSDENANRKSAQINYGLLQILDNIS